VRDVIVALLLGLGVAAALLSCAGVLLMGNALDRLHFTAPAATVSPVLFAAAVLVEAPLSSAGVKAVLIALLVIVTTPVLTHATARAARVREHGEWKVLTEELERTESPR
jgi:monovalent cation/proton antiporter MnhG/PhaG subunit